ncbi:hypothetical protein [Desulfosoma caldarium]|uniref:DUF1640 domain-containing protein n=1 Tax=Desulfosoma caldarium TaxID=610254 RepID=A0A3N1VSM4_9BACT|nr:hypothetical protein [Desulfosoma caldarium]ROR03222.1 hypothetical protein EDC27_0484 [Desulfosoma caldarium]
MPWSSKEKLTPEVHEAIGEAVERALAERLPVLLSEHLEQYVRGGEAQLKELSLLERVIRVEEELRALREIEAARFESLEKRFEALHREVQARFEAVDKRFEAVDKRFEAIDKRFEAIDKRFEAVDKRFEALDKRFVTLQWSLGLGFSVLAIIIGLVRFVP